MKLFNYITFFIILIILITLFIFEVLDILSWYNMSSNALFNNSSSILDNYMLFAMILTFNLLILLIITAVKNRVINRKLLIKNRRGYFYLISTISLAASIIGLTLFLLNNSNILGIGILKVSISFLVSSPILYYLVGTKGIKRKTVKPSR